MEATYDSEELLAHVGWVRALARSMVRDAAEADDVAQEALTAALEHGPRGEVAWRGWFRVVLRNLIAERSRAGGRRTARERVVAREEALASELDSAERFSTHARVVAAVEALDEPFRTTVLLRYFDDLPQREIAARLGVPVKTVNSRLVRAHAKLRERLEAEHGGDRRSALLALIRLADHERAAAAPWRVFGLAAAALVAVATLAWFVAQRKTGIADPLVVASEPAPSDSAPTVASAQSTDAQRSVFVPGPRQGDLEGRVLDSQGRPISGASIEVSERPAAGLPFANGAFAAEERLVERTTSDAGGRWRMLAPRNRPLDVRVRAPGFARARHADVFVGTSCETTLERPATLTLVCRDPRKQPLANAKIELLERERWQPLFVDRTDANGRWSSSEVPPGAWSVSIVLASGSSPTHRLIALSPGQEVEREVVVLDGVSLTGRVVDAADRTPIANARLSVDQHDTVLARSDANGLFQLSHVAANSDWALYADADGFATGFLRVVAPDGALGATPAPVEVALTRGWTLRGRLVDVDGAPIADAWVVTYASGSTAGSGMRLGEQPSVTSDANGAFELTHLSPELGHALYVSVPGRAREAWLLPVGASGETIDVGEVRVSVGATVAGRVLDGRGRPFAGSHIEFSRDAAPTALAVSGRESARASDGMAVTTVSSGPTRGEEPALTVAAGALAYVRVDLQRDGTFRAVDLAPGRWTVRCMPANGSARVSREVDLVPGQSVEGLELRLPSGNTLAGKVLDPDRKPLFDATLILYREDARFEYRVAMTDGEGRFRFDGLEDGRYRVRADYVHFAESGLTLEHFDSRTVEGVRSGGPELEIVLGRTVRLRGRVVDARGAPLGGALVNAHGDEDDQHQALCDVDGRFEFEVAESAKLTVSADWPGPAAQSSSAKRLKAKLTDVQPGSEELVLVLE